MHTPMGIVSFVGTMLMFYSFYCFVITHSEPAYRGRVGCKSPEINKINSNFSILEYNCCPSGVCTALWCLLGKARRACSRLTVEPRVLHSTFNFACLTL